MPRPRRSRIRTLGAPAAHPAGAMMMLGDASNRFISDSVDLAIVRALVSIGGSEVISEF